MSSNAVLLATYALSVVFYGVLHRSSQLPIVKPLVDGKMVSFVPFWGNASCCELMVSFLVPCDFCVSLISSLGHLVGVLLSRFIKRYQPV